MVKNLLQRLLLIALLAIPFSSCRQNVWDNETDAALQRLDAAIESFEGVISLEEKKIDVLTATLYAVKDKSSAKQEILELMNSYQLLAIDSLSKYASLYSELARTKDENAIAAIKLSYIAQVKEDFVTSVHIFDDIDTCGLSEPVYKSYLKQGESIIYSMFIRSSNSEDGQYLNKSSDHYRERLRELRQKYLELDSDSKEAILTKVSELRDDKNYEQAMSLLKANEKLFITSSDKSQFHRYKSVLYDFIKDDRQRLISLIYSEYYNFQAPSFDHLSLISVAKIMASRKDYERAAKYISVAEKYSLKFKHVARMAYAGNAQKSILAAVDKERQSNQQRLYGTVAILSIVSIFLILSLSYVVRTRKKIEIANEKLKESDLIKDNYLFEYMTQSVEYLQKADDYHKDLRKLAKSDIDMLLAQLRLPSPFEGQRKDFFKVYDRNFLHLFPNFLSGVNSMMKEGCQYEINNNGTMPVELRVLSVIRLGMVDNSQIAAFMDYSITTVYTYRSRAAEKSIFDRERFEKKLLNIPL